MTDAYRERVVTYERARVCQFDQLRNLQPFVVRHPPARRFLTLDACELAVSDHVALFKDLASRRSPDERPR